MTTNPAVQTSTNVRINTPKLIKSVLAWVLAILLAIAFTLAGGIKLIGVPGMVQEFAQIGLGRWFRYFTGARSERSNWIAHSQSALLGRLQIAVVMVGTTVANLTILHLPAVARVTAILLALALLFAWLRRAEALLPSGKAG